MCQVKEHLSLNFNRKYIIDSAITNEAFHFANFMNLHTIFNCQNHKYQIGMAFFDDEMVVLFLFFAANCI